MRTVALVALGAALAACLALAAVTAALYSPTYVARVVTHIDSSMFDYRLFPARAVAASDDPYRYEAAFDPSLPELAVPYRDGSGHERSATLSAFVEQTDTASFIVVKDDVIVYEQYANGFDENATNTSFSLAKSVVSLLVGNAIEDGSIEGVDQPVTDFIGEFAGTGLEGVTVGDLLAMRSPLAYDEDKPLWFGDDTLTYWSPDLRALALGHTACTDAYAGRFHYNNYHPLLLGIILERATGSTPSALLERLWQDVGAERDASWSLDSDASGFEKMESGINFCARDFAKLGSMMLHEGFWNDRQVASEEWVRASTRCALPVDEGDYEGSFLEGRGIGYQYMWYCQAGNDVSGDPDFFAWGKSDQVLYVSPQNDVVILRTGMSDGGVSDWPETLRALAGQIASPSC